MKTIHKTEYMRLNGVKEMLFEYPDNNVIHIEEPMWQRSGEHTYVTKKGNLVTVNDGWLIREIIPFESALARVDIKYNPLWMAPKTTHTLFPTKGQIIKHEEE